MGSHSEPSTQPEEFQALYEKHSKEVWALVYARWMDANAAMDIMQEAFLRLWKKWQEGEEIHNPKAWLLRVARNLAEDYVKSAFRRNGTHPPQSMNQISDVEQIPLERLIKEEQFSRIRNLIGELPESDRQVLVFRYALNYSSSEIAERLGINTAAVHMRLSRARQRLGEMIKGSNVT